MKRIVIGVLICLLLCQFSYADTIQLDTLTDDEIVQLLQDVQQEVVDRKIEKSAQLISGDYIIGKDIPVGAYVFSTDNEEEVTIYVYRDGINDLSHIYKSHTITKSNPLLIQCDEGDLYSIPEIVTITIYSAVSFS